MLQQEFYRSYSPHLSMDQIAVSSWVEKQTKEDLTYHIFKTLISYSWASWMHLIVIYNLVAVNRAPHSREVDEHIIFAKFSGSPKAFKEERWGYFRGGPWWKTPRSRRCRLSTISGHTLCKELPAKDTAGVQLEVLVTQPALLNLALG